MATVSLQTVFDSAHRALETGAADKAIGIAQHILAHFPRMIEGHRLLGEAYLNANEPEQAVAAFEQVLQADPENVAAYYGLGLAQQSLDQRPAAIAAFERALEIQPNLADLRTQLMRLYSETPGSAGQFRLSRAGLGRLYARGGMFGQSIDEFRAVLDADPERDDVTVALAEALWRDGQEDEATDFCRDVLDRRPDLLKPTVLLGYMLFAGGQPEGESLWRRAAEQDASMTTARALFDILPPIRLEEPALSEFDEAEWRAQQAQRVAVQPLQPSVAAVANDDDFFADSWLSSTGSAPASSNHSRIYDSAPTPTPAFAPQVGGDDDDLLASLLGFADAPPAAAPAPSAVEPFGLDNWDVDTTASRQSAEALPPTLDEIGLPESTPSAEAETVKPFSFDDWSFDDDPPASGPAAQQPAAQQPSNEFDLGGVEAFSFEDDSSFDTTQPFSFEAEPGAPDGVQPFSLDDDLDGLGDVEPFSLDTPTGQASTSARASDEGLGAVQPFSLDTPTGQASTSARASDEGLGAVQPFSLDEWGLDEAAPSLNGLEARSGSDANDDLGDFKPFSLDELSLDSLDADPDNSLSGPQLANESEMTEDSAGFSWEEPSWRTQRSTSSVTDTQEGESIFAKLMRNRPQDPPPAEPSSSEPEPALDEGDPTFFSLDEEPLRLDLDNDLAAVPTIDQLDLEEPVRPDASDTTADLTFDAFAMPSETSATGDTPAFGTSAHLSTDSSDEIDQLFSWEQPEPTSASAAEQESPFSWQQPEPTPAPAAEQETPFSLSDLGFSEDELASLDVQLDAATTDSSAADAVDMTPFSLADLGLSDDELAALDLQDNYPVTPEQELDAGTLPDVQPVSSSVDADEVDLAPFSLDDVSLTAEPVSSSASADEVDLAPFSLDDVSLTAEPVSSSASADEVDLTPFSLADLGLTDDELAAINIGEHEAAPAEPTADLQLSTDAPSPDGAAVGEDEVDLTPFSLGDFGLSEDELALLNQQVVDAEASFDDDPALYTSTDETTSASEPVTVEPETPESTVPVFEATSWFDLSDEVGQSVDEALDQPQLMGPGDDAELETLNRSDFVAETSEEPAPFSLADLGLSDDELALFEQIQSEQPGAETDSSFGETETAAAEADVPSAPEPTFDWPFAQADSGQLAPVDELESPFASIDAAAPIFEPEQASPFVETDSSVASEPVFEWPFADASAPAAADASAASGNTGFTQPSETAFAWPFDDEDAVSPAGETDTGLPFAQADQAQQFEVDTMAAGPVFAAASIGDESAGAVAPVAVDDAADAQPLPMDLPEGAQAVEATAAALPAVAAAPAPRRPSVTIGADPGLMAIHAQLAADPENHAMRLAIARMSQQTNNLDQAVEQYKQLIKRGELLDEVVDDLQDVIVESDEPQMLRRLHRLLGDAYMKQNRFREAMDEYSWTLARRS